MKTLPAKPRRPRVALLIETSRGYGRDLLMGVAQYVRVHGPWSLDFEEGDVAELGPAWFNHWKGDGVIARIKSPAMARAIAVAGVPAVDLHGGVPDLDIPLLRSDEEAVGRLAAEHLLDRGFQQFAFCGFSGLDWSDRRRNGFEKRIRAAGFPCQVFENPLAHPTVRVPRDPAHGLKYELQLRRWLYALPRPIGLMAYNDVRGRQVLNACRDLKLAVPEDVAVIGVDKDEVLGELSELPLSSVILDTQGIGYEAAALLDRLMAGQKPTENNILIGPKGIATRQSTEVLATEDRMIAAALHFIRKHACEGVDVNDLLRAVPLARRSLERRFIAITGRSPKAEILRVRLERAKQLLTDSDLPLPIVAEKAGFRHAEYLSRIFKKKTGLTPGDYRGQSHPAQRRQGGIKVRKR